MQDLKVTIIQSDLYWESIDANLAMFEEKIWQIEGAQDLILLPEMFSTGFTMNATSLAEPVGSKTLRWMKQQAAQTKAVIMGSYIVQQQGHCFNRLYSVFPDGQTQHYDKRHLFGLAGEDKPYTRGSSRLVVEIQGWRIMPLICYDLRFPVWCRSQKSMENKYEYEVLVVLANWPAKRIAAWDTLLAARAIENQAYALGANRVGTDEVGMLYNGHSAIYDFLGKRCCFSEEATIISYQLNGQSLIDYRHQFPFQDDQDTFEMGE